ncbi:MAG: sulfatase-like hydrolase/transferase [Opitutae bacterium]|nr:sulfatase-like hydrolase/transferase [Opitutae bacterium]
MRKATLPLLRASVGAALFAAAPHVSFAADAVAARPNIIVIQTDDQGFDDMGFRHPWGQGPRTPTFDALAARSVRFENFYVAPLCSPTRSMLLTGRHHLRTGVWGVHAGQDFLSLDETTVAQPLRAAGYRTGFMGKWHVGKTTGYFPWERGFEEATMARLYVYKDNPMMRNGHPLPTEGWTEERLADMAVDFIDRAGDRPFFLYYCPITCHGGVGGPREISDGAANAGFHAPPEFIEAYQQAGVSTELARLYGSLTFLDTQLARLFAELEKRGLAKNTLVFVLGDNGPTHQTLNEEEWQRRNPSGLRGAKTRVDENGVRSFLFVTQPGHLASRVVQDVATVADLYPTILAAAGVALPRGQKTLDGFDLRPLLERGQWEHADRAWCQIEVLNSAGLEVGKLPRVDTAGLTVRPQPLLTLGDAANSIATVFSVRRGNLKLTKGSLYDVSTPDGRRERTALENPAVKAEFDTIFAGWWSGIVAQPPSFQKPVLVLPASVPADDPGVAAIATGFYAYLAVAAQGQSVRVENHAVLGLGNPGDRLTFRVAPGASTRYRASLRFRGKMPAESATLRLHLEGGATVEAATRDNDLEFPPLDLPTASPAQPRLLFLEVAGAGAVKLPALTELRLTPVGGS